MDWLDYIGNRFNIKPLTDELQEVREVDEVFDKIVDNIPEEWKR